ncbi:MAG: HAMP domain-containing protein [Paludibacteraceae bacterium]|nr:HAMP domain-containing protein [Paludibacteraceae bacterium]
MRKIFRIIVLVLPILLSASLVGCNSDERDARHIHRTLVRQQQQADLLIGQLTDVLVRGESFDSVWTITRRHPDILFYVFNDERLLYWSDNWLAADKVMLNGYDRWWYGHAANAHVIGRWTQAGAYNILALIPVKYAYPLRDEAFQNTFIPPFRGDAAWSLSRFRTEEALAVSGADGTVLFYLTRKAETEAEQADLTQRLNDTFSYRNLLSDTEDSIWTPSNVRLRIFYLMFLIMFLLMAGFGLYLLIVHHGLRNMRLRTKILYPMAALVLFVFFYVFVTSVRYVRQTYETRQKKTLQEKCLFIQSALQNQYYWDTELSASKTQGLNIELRDLSFTYQSDIHVYDMSGNLVGSSVPFLFEQSLLSCHISPEPFFSSSATMVQTERLCGRSYMVAYAPFYNGMVGQIGYIAVPLFLSADEMNNDLDNFLAHLLPPYLIGLLLAFLVSWFIARALTSPLANLSESMRRFRLGSHDSHIQYDKQDEIGELVGHYNDMVDQLERSTMSLAEAERESAWRTMARQIAHEINNPLTPMKLRIQQLRRLHDEEDPRFDNYFNTSANLLVQQIDDLSRIASSFSTFAKVPEVRTTTVDIAQRLSGVITLFRSNPDNIPIRYIGPDSGVFGQADGDQLPEVFTNILKNATQALVGQPDGDIIVILKEEHDAEGDWIRISFSDNGPGIPAEIQSRIFTPNFTTKSTGTGLGLAISRNIMEGSGGRIEFETSERGTTFVVYLRKE